MPRPISAALLLLITVSNVLPVHAARPQMTPPKENSESTGESPGRDKRSVRPIGEAAPANASDRVDLPEKGLDVFQAGKEKKVEARLIQQNEKTGYLLLRNTTTEILNIRFPDAFVGANAVGTGRNAQVAGPGTAQSTGLTVSQGRGRDSSGLFSIPPGQTVRLPVTSVCLEYGKPEPNANLRYVILPVETYSPNPVFHELLPLFTKTKASQKVAQAAAWHLSSGLSWTELSAVTNPRAGGLPLPIFTSNDLRAAKALVDKATALAVEKRDRTPEGSPSAKTTPSEPKPAATTRRRRPGLPAD